MKLCEESQFTRLRQRVSLFEIEGDGTHWELWWVLRFPLWNRKLGHSIFVSRHGFWLVSDYSWNVIIPILNQRNLLWFKKIQNNTFVQNFSWRFIYAYIDVCIQSHHEVNLHGVRISGRKCVSFDDSKDPETSITIPDKFTLLLKSITRLSKRLPIVIYRKRGLR